MIDFLIDYILPFVITIFLFLISYFGRQKRNGLFKCENQKRYRDK